MPRIFYRTVPTDWTGYDSHNWNRFRPNATEVEKLCADMEAWANANGFRIVSVTATAGGIVMGKSEQAVGVGTTSGFVFVCEQIGTAAR